MANTNRLQIYQHPNAPVGKPVSGFTEFIGSHIVNRQEYEKVFITEFSCIVGCPVY